MPTGTTPSASGTSWLAHATVATRSGRSSIVVVPYTCSIDTGNVDSALLDSSTAGAAASAESSSLPPHAVRASANAAAVATTGRMLMMFTVGLSDR